jgi:hypothetical protein
MNRRRGFAASLLTGLVALAAWALSSCSPANFTSETVIDGVRILASRATEPRAKPGDTVTVDVLAVDGRFDPNPPMNVFWLPVPCINPAGDAYYACFAGFGGDGGAPSTSSGDAGADGGVGVGAAAGFSSLAGLLPALPSATSFTFTVPQDVIIDRKGVSPSYGLVILFNIACAGHLGLIPFDPNSNNPQNIPIGCFDTDHNLLGPQDYVIGFTRVYVYADVVEINPVISQVDLGGTRLDIDGGVTTAPFTVPLCTDSKQDSCPHHAIGPVVAQSPPTTKEVWADFYSTVGTFTSGARLLFEPSLTLSIPSGTNDNFLAPNDLTGTPAQNFVWIVVHDDQGGADWVTVPLTVTSK